MRKNIGLLVPALTGGGAERVAARLSSILSLENNLFIIVYQDTEHKYDYSGTLVNMDIKAKPNNKILQLILPIRRAKRLSELKRRYKFDAVISFLDSPNIVNILSKINGCKTIISIRNYDIKQHKLKNFLFSFIYKKADSIVTVSKVIEKKIIDSFKISPSKVITIYNPYDIDQIKELSSENLDTEHESFFRDGFIFISVGRQVYQKGFWHLIKAFKMVSDKHPEAKLVIIGKDELGGKAQMLVNDLGIESKVLFIGFHKNPFKYISRSNVYVLSSLFEGFPNTLAEAMACGCAVIATDCKSGPREILYKDVDMDKECLCVDRADYGLIVPTLEWQENWDSKSFSDKEVILSQAMSMYIEQKDLYVEYKTTTDRRIQDFSYDNCLENWKSVII